MVVCCWCYVGVATGGFGCDVLHVTCFMTWKKVLSCCGGLSLGMAGGASVKSVRLDTISILGVGERIIPL